MSDEQAVGDVAAATGSSSARRPVRDRPPSELERGGEPGRLRTAEPGDRRRAPRPRPGRAPRRPSWRRDERPRRPRSRSGRPPPVPSTSAMSSAAESPPGPRRASRSRGRSAAGRSRTDRVARRWDGASSAVGRPRSSWPTCSGVAGRAGARRARRRARRPRGPDDGSPPISPAVRTREHPEPRDSPYRGSPAASPATCDARRPAPTGRARAAARNASTTWMPLNAAWSPIDGVQRAAARGTPSRARSPTGSSATNENSARCAPIANEASNRVRTWAIAKNTAPRTIAGARTERAGPGGRREAAEEQLLADRRDDRRRDEVEQQPAEDRPSRQRARRALEERPEDGGQHDRHDEDREREHGPDEQVADAPRRRAAGRPSRAQLSAPGPTTSSRTTTT